MPGNRIRSAANGHFFSSDRGKKELNEKCDEYCSCPWRRYDIPTCAALDAMRLSWTLKSEMLPQWF